MKFLWDFSRFNGIHPNTWTKTALEVRENYSVNPLLKQKMDFKHLRASEKIWAAFFPLCTKIVINIRTPEVKMILLLMDWSLRLYILVTNSQYINNIKPLACVQFREDKLSNVSTVGNTLTLDMNTMHMKFLVQLQLMKPKLSFNPCSQWTLWPDFSVDCSACTVSLNSYCFSVSTIFLFHSIQW